MEIRKLKEVNKYSKGPSKHTMLPSNQYVIKQVRKKRNIFTKIQIKIVLIVDYQIHFIMIINYQTWKEECIF